MSELESLIPVILEKTRQGKLRWEPASTVSDNYIATLEDAALELAADSAGHPRLALLNENGRRLQFVYWGAITSPANEQLVTLYELARRQALRIDSTLQRLSDQLKAL